jgi:hypothetical protein
MQFPEVWDFVCSREFSKREDEVIPASRYARTFILTPMVSESTLRRGLYDLEELSSPLPFHCGPRSSNDGTRAADSVPLCDKLRGKEWL